MAPESVMVEQGLQKYRMYIGGQWVEPASGEWFESYNPFTGKPWALIPKGSAPDVDRAVDAAHKAFTTGDWPTLNATAARRAAAPARRPDRARRRAARRKLEVRDNGKLIAEMGGQLRYLPQWYYYFGGLADKIEGAVLPIDKPDMFNFTAPRAGRRRRGDHAVELAAAAAVLEAGAGARRRLHRRRQAVGISRRPRRSNSASCRGGRLPARRGQRRHRLRRRGRRAAGRRIR